MIDINSVTKNASNQFILEKGVLPVSEIWMLLFSEAL